MPLIKCPDCSRDFSDSAPACPQCGHLLRPPAATPLVVVLGTQRNFYVLAAVFFGMLGVHNFYASRYTRAVIQLVLSLLLCWTIIASIVVAIWAIVEACCVRVDGNGKTMA